MANTNKDPQFTAYIPTATLEALKASAQKNHRSINAQLVYFLEQELEREKEMTVFLRQSATAEEAAEAKRQNYVVLADWAGRRVTINSLAQNAQTGEWSAEWSHSDYPGSRWDTISDSQRFIIRGEYSHYR